MSKLASESIVNCKFEHDAESIYLARVELRDVLREAMRLAARISGNEQHNAIAAALKSVDPIGLEHFNASAEFPRDSETCHYCGNTDYHSDSSGICQQYDTFNN
jgi:hypothetical protein